MVCELVELFTYSYYLVVKEESIIIISTRKDIFIYI